MPLMQEADEHFLAGAPTRFVGTWDIDRPAQEVWDELTSDEPLGWCRALGPITWTSPRPFGVGTTRTAKVGGALVVEEKFFIWEEGRRKAFSVTSASLPVFARLAEDFVVDPLGTDRCRLTWTIAMEPKGVGKAGGPANALLVKTLFDDTRKHFGAQSMTPAEQTVATSIKVVAWVRIAYGIAALFAPRFTLRFFRLDPDNPDARAWNAFLGSRDIALGIHHLKVAGDPERQGDAILLSQGCEVFDTMVVAQEIRHGRPFGFFTFAGIVFNAGMHAIWLNVHRVRRGR